MGSPFQRWNKEDESILPTALDPARSNLNQRDRENRGSRFKRFTRLHNGHRTVDDSKQRVPLLTRAISYLPYCRRCDELWRSLSLLPFFPSLVHQCFQCFQCATQQALHRFLVSSSFPYFFHYLLLEDRARIRKKIIHNISLKGRVLFIRETTTFLFLINFSEKLNISNLIKYSIFYILYKNYWKWPRLGTIFPLAFGKNLILIVTRFTTRSQNVVRSEKWPGRGLIPEQRWHSTGCWNKLPWTRGWSGWWRGREKLKRRAEIERVTGETFPVASFPRVYSVSWPRKWEPLLVNAESLWIHSTIFRRDDTQLNTTTLSPEKSFFPEKEKIGSWLGILLPLSLPISVICVAASPFKRNFFLSFFSR